MSEDNNEKLYGCSSGTTDCYGLEARYTGTTGNGTKVIGDLVLTNKWTRLPLTSGVTLPDPRNIPSGVFGVTGQIASEGSFCGYETAHAIARVFLAQLAADFGLGHLCVEVRLIKARIQYSYSIVESGVGEVINRSDGPQEKFAPREEIGDLPLSARSKNPKEATEKS